MHIVQTFWSCNNKDMIRESFGWLSPEYNLMSWTLSCLQLKEYYEDIELYTDSNAAKIFIELLKLPYAKVTCNLDTMNHYHPQLWALPKIHTYSVQATPFISIDGDVFIWKPFDKELFNSSLIVQNKEADLSYYSAVMNNVRTNLPFLPEELTDKNGPDEDLCSYNAGIMGGSDIPFFQEYCQKAFELVDRNSNYLTNVNVSAFNTIFEQYLFYRLAKRKNKEVMPLIPETIDDLRYKGFADFADVPYNKQYLHLHGRYKKSAVVCRQMADRLRNDHPEYYYRIISLFKGTGQPLYNDAYFFLDDLKEDTLARRFHFLKKGKRPAEPDLLPYQKPFVFKRTELCNDFFATASETTYPQHLVRQVKEEVTVLEGQIEQLLKNEFSKIGRTELYQMDIMSTSYPEQVFSDDADIRKVWLAGNSHYRVILSHFDWTFLDDPELSMDARFMKLIGSGQEQNAAVIVPECYGEGYSLYNADELDLLLLEELQCPRSLETLLTIIEAAFDPAEVREAKEELKALVYGRIRKGLLNKTIQLPDNTG